MFGVSGTCQGGKMQEWEALTGVCDVVSHVVRSTRLLPLPSHRRKPSTLYVGKKYPEAHHDEFATDIKNADLGLHVCTPVTTEEWASRMERREANEAIQKGVGWLRTRR